MKSMRTQFSKSIKILGLLSIFLLNNKLFAGNAVGKSIADKILNEITQNMDLLEQSIKDSESMHGVSERKSKASEGVLKTKDREWRGWSGKFRKSKDHVAANSPEWIKNIDENSCSQKLREVQSTFKNEVSEIFVMDSVGATVCYSNPTSDYDQGDEDKYWVPFQDKKDYHEGELEKDRSTRIESIQFSFPLKKGSALIGAITIGVQLPK